MPLTASQSGLGAVQGLYTDDQSYRSISCSTTRSSPHSHLPQSQTQTHQQQQQQPPHNKHQQLHLPSTSPSSKLSMMTTTTTIKAANRRHRGRTHSNTTSAIDPSALQYASKFSNSNNNVIVTSAMAGLSSMTGPVNSTMMFPQGDLHLHSHHHNTANTHASSNSSTTTTFYSGVKLAPPVLSASIEQLERRASDQKVWYTIQVCPCDLTIITPASASTSSSSTGAAQGGTSTGYSGGTGGAVKSIPRKPYRIYRRYEDVADFADQLEEEFAGRMVAPSATIGLQHDTKDFSNAASTAISTSGGVGSSSYCVNGNVIGSGSIAFTEKGMDGGTSVTNTNSINQCNTSLSSSITTVALPRLKSRLVLFVTKAVCLQRKEELDRYLQELFTLGPIIAQSRLVAEFFGIWKTDMEIHLSQEDRDPLALHSVVAMTTVSDSEKDSSIDQEHGSEAESGEDVARSEALQEASTSAGEPVTETIMLDSLPSVPTASPSPPIPSDHASALDARSPYKTSSSLTVNPTSFSTDNQSLSTTATMNSITSAYLASPSLSPSPSACAYDSQDVGWTPSLSTLLPLASETGVDVDTEMASPTELAPPVPLPLGHIHLELADGYESGAGTETETISDLTIRTIKKFKSLRRSHTSSHSRQQQQQDSNVQDDSNPVPTGRLGSVSEPSGGTPAVPLTTAAQPKSKIMKRSKTIVFRPEVTMQPLSSKNVIPPWNRIPSFANNNSSNSNNSGAAPISPISPTTPQSATTMSLSSGGSTPNTVTSGQTQAPFPTSLDMDEQLYLQQQQQQPRKLTMSHSKTMSSISTAPSWSFGNNNVDHPILAPGSLAVLPSSSVSSNSTANSSSNGGNRNGSITSTRSMSVSAGITPTTLVAPWNRANGNGETNTHLHSLITMSGQPSPSLQSPINSPFVPVELGRSFHKKESQNQRSPSNRGTRDRAVPVLTQLPEARNRNPESTPLSFAGGSAMKGRARKPGMTHSVSAPGGFLPIMTVSAPDSTQSSNSASEAMAEDVSAAPIKAVATKKRVSLHSPSLPTKQPVGILKNAQRGARKASLTVPGAVIFPVQSSPTGISAIAAVSSTFTSSSPSTPTMAGGETHNPGTLATTFKIVMDADTIVALQVLEDSSFVLTMSELRTRVKAKLTKSNIQLPDKFDLLWTVPTNSMTLTSPSPSTPTSGMSSMSIHQAATALDQGVMLKTDEDLHRAIHASRNHKVTLRCIL